MAIFNSFLLNYQRVSSENHNMSVGFFHFRPQRRRFPEFTEVPALKGREASKASVV